MYLEVTRIGHRVLRFAAVAFLCTAFSALGVLGEASAAFYSDDFSEMGFTDGQGLEGMTLDPATFTSEAGDLRYYSEYGGGIGTGYQWGAAADTYIDFSTPVNDIAFTAGNGAGDLDAFAVSLYEFGTDAFMGTWSTPKFGGPDEPEWYTLSIPASNIGRVLFDPGNSGVLPGVKELQGGVVILEMSYVVSEAIEAEIDIKPGSDPNSVNPFSRGVIPVAVLTTEDFDSLTVDADSVRFGPDEAEKRHKQAHVEDVDEDGDLDLLLYFRTEDTGIALGDTEACLIGQTFDGVPIMGCDSVRTVPPN